MLLLGVVRSYGEGGGGAGKVPGQDAILAEVYKTGSPTLLNQLTSLYQSMWEKKQLPQKFRDATIAHIYKRKGNRQSCDNHRGVSLPIVGMILARVLLPPIYFWART